MKNQTDIIQRLSVEVARTQMINNAIIRVLERKNICSEQEVLDELEIVVQEAIKNMLPHEIGEHEIDDFFNTPNELEKN